MYLVNSLCSPPTYSYLSLSAADAKPRPIHNIKGRWPSIRYLRVKCSATRSVSSWHTVCLCMSPFRFSLLPSHYGSIRASLPRLLREIHLAWLSVTGNMESPETWRWREQRGRGCFLGCLVSKCGSFRLAPFTTRPSTTWIWPTSALSQREEYTTGCLAQPSYPILYANMIGYSFISVFFLRLIMVFVAVMVSWRST